MRVTTEIWVAALLRRVFGEGGFGAVLRRGGDSAGAVFIVGRERSGEATLFGPAPQTGYDDARPEERYFVEMLRTEDEARLSDKLEREARFDPDLWVVELEPAKPAAGRLFPVITP